MTRILKWLLGSNLSQIYMCLCVCWLPQMRRNRSNPPSWWLFSLWAFSRNDVPGKTFSVRSKQSTLACWSREKREERCEAKHLCVQSDFGTRCNYLKYSSPFEALNSIVVLKFLPVEVNNSADNLTMGHICQLRRKKILELYWFKMCISLWS